MGIRAKADHQGIKRNEREKPAAATGGQKGVSIAQVYTHHTRSEAGRSSPVERVLSRLQNVKPSGNGWIARCPAHNDKHPSLSIKEGADGRVLLKCHAGCSAESIVRALGLEMRDLFPSKSTKRPERKIVATYPYHDADGRLLFEVVRYEPKDFRQRRPDGKGDWIYNLDGVQRVLYQLPEVLAAKERGEAIYVVEGEKDVESLRALGLVATTNPHGAGKWREEYGESLRGAHVVIIPDNDEVGRRHAEAVAKSLGGKAASVKVVELPSGKDVSDWLCAGGTKEALLRLVEQAACGPSRPALSYPELVATFRRWLALPNEMPLRFVLCTVIANRLPGDPLWAFIVGPSGDGKTELVNPLTGLEGVRPLDTLTVNTFLSGKQKKDPNASLLLRLPQGAILLMRDFTSVLEMHREKRDEIFSQLRKIYDGHLTRATGEGGESAELSWTGKVGLVACVTPAIEGYRAFATTLGERFLYYYLPTPDRLTVAKAARRNRASLARMREELQEAVRRFFDGLRIPPEVEVPEEIGDFIAEVADFVSRARSGVERDWYSPNKEITEIPDPEVPTRLSQQLDLLTCAHAVLMGRTSVESSDLELTRQVALACIPSHRRRLLALLFEAGDRELTTTEIANAIDLPTNTVRRYLEDLTALKLVARREGDTNAFLWKLTDFARRGWLTLTRSDTLGATQNPVPVQHKDVALQTSGYEYSNTPTPEGSRLCLGGDVCSATPQGASQTENLVTPRPSDDPINDEEIPF